MKQERLTLEEGMEQGKCLPFALIRDDSLLHLGKVPQDICLETLQEARFFSQEEEIRVYRREGQLYAVKSSTESDEETVSESYPCRGKHLGTEVSICQHLEFDEDGQVFVAYRRLTHWKGGKTDDSTSTL